MTIGTPFLFLVFVFSMALNSISVSGSDDAWRLQNSGVSASLRGLHVVDAKSVWASGTAGTVIRTVDSGQTWTNVSVSAAEQLDFRDIHAVDAQTAVVISAGQPARVYFTTDAGKSWDMSFEYPDKRSFFDSISFWDARRGIAMSDPIDGQLLLIETSDGGKSWQELPLDRRPKVSPGEAGFAASGTNMQIVGNRILIALGGAEEGKYESTSRVVYSDDRAESWKFATVPIERSASSGIFSLAFADQEIGIAVGGDYLQPEKNSDNVALTGDGGTSWKVSAGHHPRGYRSGVAFWNSGKQRVAVCVGPNGTDISIDDGQSWKAVSDQGFHAIAFDPTATAGFASGADGRIAKWTKEFHE